MKKLLGLMVVAALALGMAFITAMQGMAQTDEVIYLADSGLALDGYTTLFTVSLDEPESKAILTPLPVAGNISPALGPGIIPFNQVDALACTADGKYLYGIDKYGDSSHPGTGHIGMWDIDNPA